MDQSPVPADEEAVAVGDFQVVDGLDLVAADPGNFGNSADGPDRVAWSEFSGHGPPLSGLPEAVNLGRDDRFAIEFDSQGRRRLIVEDGEDGPEIEFARGDVLGQDLVADSRPSIGLGPIRVRTGVPAPKQE